MLCPKPATKPSTLRAVLCATVSVAVSMTAVAPAFAQTAETPTVQVGDAWTYAQTSDNGKEKKETTWTRRVTAVGGDGYDTQIGSRAYKHDPAGNYVNPRGAEFNRAVYKFPMQVGAEWSYTAKFDAPVIMDQRGTHKVVAYESLTVPAGTFDCFKVEGKAEVAYKASYHNEVRETYWYCPKVNGVAKISRQTVVNSRDTPSWQEKLEQVLTRYTPKG
jgi:hypothetical protein